MTAKYRYHAAGFYMVRVNRWPVQSLDWNEVATLRTIVGRDFDLALRHAAPGLHAWVNKDLRGGKTRNRNVESKLLSLRRYHIRARTRPTPYGLFSAVGIGELHGETFDRTAHAPTEANVTINTRPDLGLVTRLVGQEVPQNRYWTNDLVRPDSDRLFIPGAFAFGVNSSGEARVRRTRASEHVLELARSMPQKPDTLVTSLRALYPEIETQRLIQMVDQLIDLGFLVPDPLPLLNYTTWDQEQVWGNQSGSAATKLTALTRSVSADQHDEIEGILEYGENVARDAGYSGPSTEIHAILTQAGQSLPTQVGEAVSDAATFLTSIASGAGDGSLTNQAGVRGYHAAFLERYGFGTAVRVTDLVDPVRGLGEVAEPLAHPQVETANPGLTKYEWILHDLLVTALQRGAISVDIDSRTEQHLRDAAPVTASQPLHPTIDVFVQLEMDHVVEGGLRVVLNHLPVAEGGTSFGRFAHGFDADLIARLREIRKYRTGKPLDPEIEVQVSYVPENHRATNVAISPITGDYTLNVNTAAGESAHLKLEDIWVVADYERLMIWSRSLGREVYVAQSHMLNAQLAPDVIQLLLQISAVRRRPLGGFSWGPLEGSRRLPRVTRKGVVLRVAEWTISADKDLDTNSLSSFRATMDEWRQEFDVPRYVYDTQEDHRLLLDLDSAFAMQHLHAESRRRNVIRLHEALPAPDRTAIIDDGGKRYMSEYVIPVVLHEARSGSKDANGILLRELPAWESVTEPYYQEAPLEERDGWLSYALYQPSRMNHAVVDRIQRELMTGVLKEYFTQWYFVQYRDTRPHLRIRLKLAPGVNSTSASEEIRQFHARLRARGISSDVVQVPYRPEYGRYGGVGAFALFESLFTMESSLAARVFESSIRDVDRVSLLVGLLDSYLRYFLPGVSERQEFIAKTSSGPISDYVRGYVRKERLVLLEALDAGAGMDRIPRSAAGRLLNDALPSLEDALARAAQEISFEHSQGMDPSQESVLRSVMHMTANRFLKFGHEDEQDIHNIWWLALRNMSSREAFDGVKG